MNLPLLWFINLCYNLTFIDMICGYCRLLKSSRYFTNIAIEIESYCFTKTDLNITTEYKQAFAWDNYPYFHEQLNILIMYDP